MKTQKICALYVGPNANVDHQWQLADSRKLTAPAPTNPLEFSNTVLDESTVVNSTTEIADLTLPCNDYFYQYALNSQAVQEYINSNCADLNPLNSFEQQQHWIYYGQMQWLIDHVGVDTFYNC